MNSNIPYGGRAATALLECGDLSPLSAGDLSPSDCRITPPSNVSSSLRQPEDALLMSHRCNSDGDESPAESGENSPHSTAPPVFDAHALEVGCLSNQFYSQEAA